jgi:hypothetical protein
MLQKRFGLRKNYFLQQGTVGKISAKKLTAQFFFALSVYHRAGKFPGPDS